MFEGHQHKWFKFKQHKFIIKDTIERYD